MVWSRFCKPFSAWLTFAHAHLIRQYTWIYQNIFHGLSLMLTHTIFSFFKYPSAKCLSGNRNLLTHLNKNVLRSVYSKSWTSNQKFQFKRSLKLLFNFVSWSFFFIQPMRFHSQLDWLLTLFSSFTSLWNEFIPEIRFRFCFWVNLRRWWDLTRMNGTELNDYIVSKFLFFGIQIEQEQWAFKTKHFSLFQHSNYNYYNSKKEYCIGDLSVPSTSSDLWEK